MLTEKPITYKMTTRYNQQTYLQLTREQQLTLALELQQECTQELKDNLVNRQQIVEMQSWLIQSQSETIQELRNQLNRVNQEKNFQWN